MPPVEPFDVCVVGGGVGGLRVTQLVLAARPDASVLLLEARDRPGGRAKTVRSDSGDVLYEAGPWRVPAGHGRLVSLFESHKIPLGPLRTPRPSVVAGKRREGDPKENIPGLSRFDVDLLRTESPRRADEIDHAEGYSDNTEGDSTAEPYRTTGDRFYVPLTGFSSLADSMARGLERMENVQVHYGARVTDVVAPPEGGSGTGTYTLTLRLRTKERSFRDASASARCVFVCVPPHVALGWPSLAPRIPSHLHRVGRGCLHHVYVNGTVFGPPAHVIDVRTPLIQTVGDEYGTGWMQASYTGGRMARFWARLRVIDPSRFRSLVLTLMKKMFPSFAAKRAVGNVQSHFKEAAYHFWRPAYHFDVNSAVLASVTPSPVRLPGLFWAGEAFSSYQAWIEGALETAELAVEAWSRGGGPLVFETRAPFSDEISVDGRVLGRLTGPRGWCSSHPGGAEAILNHLGEDATDLFLHIGHSPTAWATVAALQVAWADK